MIKNCIFIGFLLLSLGISGLPIRIFTDQPNFTIEFSEENEKKEERREKVEYNETKILQEDHRITPVSVLKMQLADFDHLRTDTEYSQSPATPPPERA